MIISRPLLAYNPCKWSSVLEWIRNHRLTWLSYCICSLKFPYLAAIDQTSSRLEHIGVRKSLIFGIAWKSGVSETRSRGWRIQRETEREKIEFWQYFVMFMSFSALSCLKTLYKLTCYVASKKTTVWFAWLWNEAVVLLWRYHFDSINWNDWEKPRNYLRYSPIRLRFKLSSFWSRYRRHIRFCPF